MEDRQLDSSVEQKRDGTSSSSSSSSASASSGLSSQLQNSIPLCAQSCVAAYINQEFSCAQGSLSCLCAQYGSTGYTFGELAYGCLQTQCSNASLDVQVSQYSICSSQTSTVAATHSTVTLPTLTGLSSTPSTSTTSDQTTAPSSSSQPTASSTSASQTQAAPSSNVTPPPSASSSIASQTSAANASATAAPASSSPALSNAQIIGISVASMVALLAIVLAVLFVCLRRRRTKQVSPKSARDSFDFIDQDPEGHPPYRYGAAGNPRGYTRAELPGDGIHSGWYGQSDVAKEPRLQPHVNAAFAAGNPGMQHPYSQVRLPRSHNSTRAVSQLLPDKPCPPPPSHAPRKVIMPATPATVFEEDADSPPLPRSLQIQIPPTAARAPITRKPVSPTFAGHLTKSPEEFQQPRLSLEIPKVVMRADRTRSKTPSMLWPLPSSPLGQHLSADSRPKSTRSSQTLTSANSYIPHYYTATDGESTNNDDSPTPIEEDEQKRRVAPANITISRPTYPPMAVRTSVSSDTSFESNDPEEPTPPEEEVGHRLSPVAESPMAAVRYPKIPRSSNQSIPRSPKPVISPRNSQKPVPQPTTPQQKRQSGPTRPRLVTTPDRQGSDSSASSGATLAAKRRGPKASHDLEAGLDIKNSARFSPTGPPSLPSLDRNVATADTHRGGRGPTQESPLKGYGRSANGRLGATRRPSYAGGGYGSPSPEMQTPRTQVIRLPDRDGQGGVMKSPLWAPKLTPSRKGDDLFLSVSIASPTQQTWASRR